MKNIKMARLFVLFYFLMFLPISAHATTTTVYQSIPASAYSPYSSTCAINGNGQYVQAASGTCVIFIPIVADSSLTPLTAVSVHYLRDTSCGSTMTATLYKSNNSTNVKTTITSAASSYTTGSTMKSITMVGETLDPANYSYWVKVSMTSCASSSAVYDVLLEYDVIS